MWTNIHRHDEFSLYDGFGKAKDAAQYAKTMEQDAIGIANHGNVCGLIEHYEACNEIGIKPILGVETYFQPTFNKEKKPSHLCLFAMSKKGYSNIMKILTRANRDNFFRVAITDLELLEEFNEDVICTTACLMGFIPRLFSGKKIDVAKKALKRFREIFGERLFLEIMPYDIPWQREINEFIIELSKDYKIPAILTCDSHYVKKEDYDTYQVMHRVANTRITADYSERYMPTEKEIMKRFKEMHNKNPDRYVRYTKELVDMCNVKLDFVGTIPKLDWGMSSKGMLKQLSTRGLKEKGKWDDKYKDQLQHEIKTIFDLNLEDYFLLCYDIVRFAKLQGIVIGPGRGSSCGSLLTYSLGITDVDPLVLGTSFERFLRPGKKKMPDIDMDFDKERREEIIEYIIKRHPNRASQVSTFGYYKKKNLCNDLIKVFKIEDSDFKSNIDALIEDEDESVDYNELITNSDLKRINKKYSNVIKHFSKLYGQIRFVGKHAAGLAITSDDIDNYVTVMRLKDKYQVCYDLNSLSKINVLKIDVLGLANMSVISDINKAVGKCFDYDMLRDKEVYKEFRNGNTIGVFQFEKQGARDIIKKIQPNNIQDIIAATALNRPAPLKLGILEKFIEGKRGNVDKNTAWYKYTKDTYGCIVYQECVMNICRGLARMEWDDVDKVMKALREAGGSIKVGQEELDRLKNNFINGAYKYSGVKKKDGENLYDQMTLYLFNKGHGTGYGLISFYEMYLKHYYPLEFYCALLKHEEQDIKRHMYTIEAIQNEVIVLLPHVNGAANYKIAKLTGEKVIQEGLSSIKNIGIKSAEMIEKLGPYEDEDDFFDKVPKRIANTKVENALKENGALEFNRKRFLDRVVRRNSSLYSKKAKIW